MRVIQIVRGRPARESEESTRLTRVLQVAGIVVLTAGAAALLGTWLVRDQIERSRRDLFSPHPLRRLAALGYVAGREASVDMVRLLRDYTHWEPRPLIRRRAIQILERMEKELSQAPPTQGEIAG